MKACITLFLAAGLAFSISAAGAEESHTMGLRPAVEPLAGQAAGPDKEESAVNLLFQPAGFLQFGPVVEFEFRLAPGVLLGAHVRFHGLGLLSHLVALDYTEIWGIAGGLGVRVFVLPGGVSEGFFVGGVTEVGVNGYYDDIGYATAYHGAGIFIVAAANSGYRWRFGNFILEAGAYAGVAPTVYSKYSYDNTPSVMYDGLQVITFFGFLELSLGWML